MLRIGVNLREEKIHFHHGVNRELNFPLLHSVSL